jgi:octaprenyl-diphosphate synthase
MTSKEYTKRLTDVEEALGRVFPVSVSASWVREVAAVDGLSLPQAALDRIQSPGWELLRRGGKRWRPLVMTLSHDLYGGSLETITDLTTLVELPHNGSLIIDDIEDGSDQRRGGPAIHLVHGVDMAINTGNFLYFAPTYLIESSGLDEASQYRLTKLYLRTMRRLHLGQGLDIVWHNDHSSFPSADDYLQMCRFKTGALARLAAELGAAAAGAPDAEVEAVGTLWEDIGVGFQVLDDVKNLVSGNPGKRRGDDIVEGKKSLPALLHAERAADGGTALLELFSRVPGAENPWPLVEQAIALMGASGAVDAAAERGRALLDGARRRLERWPASEARLGMETLMATFEEGLKA